MPENELRLLSAVMRLNKHGDLGAHYKQGPQGNSVADFRADYEKRYGTAVPQGKLGSDDTKDIRDNRDPTQVGNEILASRELERKAQGNGHEVPQPGN